MARLLDDAHTHVYICGLKGMESGVDEAFADVCRGAVARLGSAQDRDARGRPLSRRDLLSLTTRPRPPRCYCMAF